MMPGLQGQGSVSVRKSLAYSFLDRYASLLIGIVSTMVLARLLTPAELGVFSVAMAMLAIAATVRDMGAGNYLLQEKDLTSDRIRAVWALQLGLGVLVSIAMAWQGHGAVSLAWGSLCATIVNAGVSIFYRPGHFPWLPGVREMGRVLAFGTKLTTSSILTTIAKASPDFFLAKLQGMAAAGLPSSSP